MKRISIIVLALVLTAFALAGCRRRNENGTSEPNQNTVNTQPSATTNPTTEATVPAATDNHRETNDNGIVDDMITEGSEIIDDILPDGTRDTDGTDDNAARNRNRNMPR